jgi:hypothetical protein
VSVHHPKSQTPRLHQLLPSSPTKICNAFSRKQDQEQQQKNHSSTCRYYYCCCCYFKFNNKNNPNDKKTAPKDKQNLWEERRRSLCLFCVCLSLSLCL